MGDLNYYLGITPWGIFAVMVATVVMYAVFVSLLGVVRRRLFSSPSSFDLAVVAVLGAVVGRSILGEVPTLSGGLVALGTLFGLVSISARVRRVGIMSRWTSRRGVALFVAGEPEVGAMRHFGIDEKGLWAAMRAAGIHHPDEASLVVLERTGSFSVLRAGAPIHPDALTGIHHAEAIFKRLTEAGHTSTFVWPTPVEKPGPHTTQRTRRRLRKR